MKRSLLSVNSLKSKIGLLLLYFTCLAYFKANAQMTDCDTANLRITSVVPSGFPPQFTWQDYCSCAFNYEVQILRLYNTDPNIKSPDSVYAHIDWSEALSHLTNQGVSGGPPGTYTLSYLTLTEGTGYYAWRVRRICTKDYEGRAHPDTWGPWTYTGIVKDDTTVKITHTYDSLNTFIFYYEQFDDDINWIHRRTFGDAPHWYFEESQVNEKIDYANYLLMPIQHQDLIHENWLKDKRHNIYSETVIDYSGRPSLQSLPAAVSGSSIWLQYYNNLFQNYSGAFYKPSDFDDKTNYNNPTITSGIISDYYSSSNSDIRISDAEGLTFSRTLYYNDPLNRPREISSPGAAHAPDPAHNPNQSNANTIRKFYGKANSRELLNILGDEAPMANMVSKTYTVDPNGTINVTFTDEFDRTIITCLMPPGRDSLEAITFESHTNDDTVTGKVDISPTSVLSKATYVFATPTELSYLYKLYTKTYWDNCFNVCASCDYKVTITAKERYDTTTYRWTGNVTPEIDTTTWHCSGTEFSTSGTYAIPSSPLSPGTYDVSLLLEVNTQDPATNKYYIDSVIDVLDARMDTSFSNGGYVLPITGLSTLKSVDSMRYYAVNNDLASLAKYLEADTTKSSFQISFNNGCNVFTLPTVNCKRADCDAPKFAEYMKRQMKLDDSLKGSSFFADAYSNTTNHGVAFTTDTLNLFIVESDTEFNGIINRMVLDGYDCGTLWDAWVVTVREYIAGQKTIVPTVTSLAVSTPKYDWWQNFMEKVGFIYPFTPRAKSELFTVTDSVRRKPYKYFPYDWHTDTSAENIFCYMKYVTFPCSSAGTPPSWYSTIYNFPTYTPETENFHIYNFYKRLKNTGPNNDLYLRTVILKNSIKNLNPALGNSYNELYKECVRSCDGRLTGLMSALNDHYQDEWDVKVEGYTYSAWRPKPVDSVTLSQVFCLANAIVNKCESMCDVTPDSSGYLSSDKINTITKAYLYDIDVYSEPNSSESKCPDDFEAVTVDSASNTAGLLVWLNYLNGRIRDSLTAAGITTYDWRALQNIGSLGFSPVSGPPCDTTKLTLNSNEHISYFCYGTEVRLSNSSCLGHPVHYYRSAFDSVHKKTVTTVNLYVALGDSLATNDSIVVVENLPTGFTYRCGDGMLSGTQMLYTIYGPKNAGDSILITYDVKSPATLGTQQFNGGAYLYESGALTDSCKVNSQSIVVADCINLNYVAMSGTVWEPVYRPLCRRVCSELHECGGSVCIKWENTAPDNPDTTVIAHTCADLVCANFVNALDHQVSLVYQARELRLRKMYEDSCLNKSLIKDIFVNTYAQEQGIYTLYFYDRAGNLIRTVYPNGVVENDMATSFTKPNDAYRCEYDYDTRGNVLRSNTADGGETWYYYDAMSRLRFSINAKQAVAGKFSYTKYDNLDRIIETGESSGLPSAISTHVNDQDYPTTGGPSYDNKNITITTYNTAYPTGGILPTASGPFNGNYQRNLTGRISYVRTDVDGNLATGGDQATTIYSYDAQGDPDYVYQYVGGMDKARLIKTQDMKFSGKVDDMDLLDVDGTEDMDDALTFRHIYTQDGRLAYSFHIYPSHWWRDNYSFGSSNFKDITASYVYDLHSLGQVRRMELGNFLQGVDYTYGLEGWLKAVNHPDTTLDPGSDMPDIQNGEDQFGTDGQGASPYRTDLFSEVLNYYNGDFKHSGSQFDSYNNPAFLLGRGLYNGNMTGVQSRIHFLPSPYGYLDGVQTGFIYRYDQLNRLKYSWFHTYDDVSPGWNMTNEYDEVFSYDADGRMGSGFQRWAYDTLAGITRKTEREITFDYGSNHWHRLQYFKDADTAGRPYVGDLDTGIYFNYDEVGNVIRHQNTQRKAGEKEDIKITWDPYGRISRMSTILDSTGTDSTVTTYLYDHMGNRAKETIRHNGQTDNTYYVYTDDGKLLVKYTEDSNANTYKVSERYMYGLDRVGVMQGKNIHGVSFIDSMPTVHYEIKDHLGNVRVVFSDTGTKGTHNAPPIQAYNNYYAYGSLQPGRSYQNTKYNYGFNGQEKDDHIMGAGNFSNFGARENDTRLGIFISRDPLSYNTPGYSPYIFAGNSPIKYIDFNGLMRWDPNELRNYPMVQLMLQNAYNLYYNKELPSDLKSRLKGVDLQKLFNKNMRGWFEYYSLLKGTNLDEYLMPGSGPQIRINVPPTNQEGEYTSNGYTYPQLLPNGHFGNMDNPWEKNGGVIDIDPEVANVLEFELNGKTIGSGYGGLRVTDADKYRAVESFVSTLFHEGVHFGRFKMIKDGTANTIVEQRRIGGHSGVCFEEDAYGRNVDKVDKNTLTPASIDTRSPGLNTKSPDTKKSK
ncbi:MAG: hypothetical protein JST82_13995 [Bacteroidetes bacterium]|nr:hypothetical protein [Bacteroidota bacterium]